tara:strand:+ start:2119 stop:2271 length:153 start_codon:yes stop_codon:yes gene_type:complete
MPYEIVKEGEKYVVYRLPYKGETQGRRKAATADTKRNAQLYVAFAEKKDK